MPYTFLYTVFTLFPSLARHSSCSTAHPADHVDPLLKSVNSLSLLECVQKETPNTKQLYRIL